jgi:hypothetical protein
VVNAVLEIVFETVAVTVLLSVTVIVLAGSVVVFVSAGRVVVAVFVIVVVTGSAVHPTKAKATDIIKNKKDIIAFFFICSFSFFNFYFDNQSE